MWKAIIPGINVFDSQYKSILFGSKTYFVPTSKTKYQFFPGINKLVPVKYNNA